MLAHNENAITSQVQQPAAEFDVCILVEGCYPFVSGGVSSWLNWLIRSQPELSFAVIAIVNGPGPREPRYQRPPNLKHFEVVNLSDAHVLSRRGNVKQEQANALGTMLADAGADLIADGGMHDFTNLLRTINSCESSIGVETLLNSALAWETVQKMYLRLVPRASFLQFFWAWRALLGGLFRLATCPLPQARVYHAISTGYAGMLAARAQSETGAPTIITEHGIYTNERRIDILLADWISDTIEKGLSLEDTTNDVRDIWVKAFEAYAKCAYESATFITTLFSENQALQRLNGAPDKKLRVIANGIDLATFAKVQTAAVHARPTVALIGRVVPIKDVKTFIRAIALLHHEHKDVEALIIGPTDEDELYYKECCDLVEALDVADCITFTGNVRVTEYLPRIHVLVLTSLSEAQPLVVLEAGAASIPCVATNVGCCKELVEGTANENPQLGQGGLITDAVAPEQTAAAISRLLSDHEEREAFGAAMKARTERYYNAPQAAANYRALYQEAFARSANKQVGGEAM
ncbi:MAG: GT4 family glycosyltransferase PelF [Hyphomicrobiaceae bacterium]